MNRNFSDEQKRDEELQGALAALRRAKRSAEDLAIATGTCIVESDGDKIVSLASDEIIARRLRLESS